MFNMVSRCWLCKEHNTKYVYHRFPNDVQIRKLWLEQIDKINSVLPKSAYLCSKHFAEDSYDEHVAGKFKRLKKNAIPLPIPRSRNEPSLVKYQEEAMGSSTENMVPATTNYQKFEEVYIKEEPLEETSGDSESYENVLQSVRKEECISDNDEQIDKACDNSVTTNNDIPKAENSNVLYCSVCNKSCRWKSTLIEHMKIHDEIKDFECSVCKKLFSTNYNLKAHMKTHSDIKEYKCDTCNKLFTHNSNLSQHMKTHNEEKEYKCTICHKLFSQSSSLYKHRKIHSGTKEFHCSMCGKSFRQSSTLKRHMNSIHSQANTLLDKIVASL